MLRIGLGFGINRGGILPSTPAPPTDFIIKVKTDNAGTSASNQFTFTGGVGGYDVLSINQSTFVEQTFTGLSGAATLTFSEGAGVYVLKLTPTGGTPFNRLAFSNGGDKLKLTGLLNWGDVVWSSLASMFDGCLNLTTIEATDVPNLTIATSLVSMFRRTGITYFDGRSWNWSNIQQSDFMFAESKVIEINIENCDFSSMANIQWFCYLSNQLTTFKSLGTSMSNVITADTVMRGTSVLSVFECDMDFTSATNLSSFFFGSSINQNLNNIQLRLAGVNLNSLFRSSGMSTANYTDSVVNLANYAFENSGTPINVNMTSQTGRTFDTARSGGANFANAGEGRTYLTGTLGWTISGDTVI